MVQQLSHFDSIYLKHVTVNDTFIIIRLRKSCILCYVCDRLLIHTGLLGIY